MCKLAHGHGRGIKGHAHPRTHARTHARLSLTLSLARTHTQEGALDPTHPLPSQATATLDKTLTVSLDAVAGAARTAATMAAALDAVGAAAVGGSEVASSGHGSLGEAVQGLCRAQGINPTHLQAVTSM